MIQVKLRNRIYDFPGGWNELTRKQLVYLARMFRMGLTREQIEVLWLAYITSVSLRWIYIHVEPEAFLDFRRAMDWIFQEIDLVEQKIQVLRGRKGLRKWRLYGPERALGDVTVEQFFGYSEAAYSLFLQTGEQKYLDWLVASLYTEQKEVFIPERVNDVKKKVEKADADEKFAVFLWYLGSRNYLISMYGDLFSEQQGEKKDFDFLRLITSLNQGDVTKNEILKKTNIWEMLEHLRNLKKLQEKTEKYG